jgi:hypothetical protein
MKKQKSEGQQLALRSNGSASRARARRTVRWHATFIQALRKSPNITAACHAAGVNRTTAYRHREDDESFAAKWDEALDQSVDEVEETAFRIAKEGDNQMIQFVLKAHRPAIYRERSEVAVAGGIIILPAKEKGAE